MEIPGQQEQQDHQDQHRHPLTPILPYIILSDRDRDPEENRVRQTQYEDFLVALNAAIGISLGDRTEALFQTRGDQLNYLVEYAGSQLTHSQNLLRTLLAMNLEPRICYAASIASFLIDLRHDDREVIIRTIDGQTIMKANPLYPLALSMYRKRLNIEDSTVLPREVNLDSQPIFDLESLRNLAQQIGVLNVWIEGTSGTPLTLERDHTVPGIEIELQVLIALAVDTYLRLVRTYEYKRTNAIAEPQSEELAAEARLAYLVIWPLFGYIAYRIRGIPGGNLLTLYTDLIYEMAPLILDDELETRITTDFWYPYTGIPWFDQHRPTSFLELKSTLDEETVEVAADIGSYMTSFFQGQLTPERIQLLIGQGVLPTSYRPDGLLDNLDPTNRTSILQSVVVLEQRMVKSFQAIVWKIWRRRIGDNPEERPRVPMTAEIASDLLQYDQDERYVIYEAEYDRHVVADGLTVSCIIPVNGIRFLKGYYPTDRYLAGKGNLDELYPELENFITKQSRGRYVFIGRDTAYASDREFPWIQYIVYDTVLKRAFELRLFPPDKRDLIGATHFRYKQILALFISGFLSEMSPYTGPLIDPLIGAVHVKTGWCSIKQPRKKQRIGPIKITWAADLYPNLTLLDIACMAADQHHQLVLDRLLSSGADLPTLTKTISLSESERDPTVIEDFHGILRLRGRERQRPINPYLLIEAINKMATPAHNILEYLSKKRRYSPLDIFMMICQVAGVQSQDTPTTDEVRSLSARDFQALPISYQEAIAGIIANYSLGAYSLDIVKQKLRENTALLSYYQILVKRLR